MIQINERIAFLENENFRFDFIGSWQYYINGFSHYSRIVVKAWQGIK